MSELPQGYVRLPNSELSPRALPGFAEDPAPLPLTQELTITIRLRSGRKDKAPPNTATTKVTAVRDRKYSSRRSIARRYGASTADLKEVIDFVSKNNLEVLTKIDRDAISRRHLMVRGNIGDLTRTFGVQLRNYQASTGIHHGSSGDKSYVGRGGFIHVPDNLVGVIEGIFGLDTRPIGAPATAMFPRSPGLPKALSPPEVARYYNFPKVSAKAQTIGLLEFGGGYVKSDIDAYFKHLKLSAPTLTDVSIDGATNSPGSNTTYDCEVTLDIDVAGSIAQTANIIVYFAPHTEQGWIDAVAAAVYDNKNNPSVLSISWGAAELQRSNTLLWTRAGILAMNELFREAACLGVTVLAATGDYGTWCKVDDLCAHVLYPASDPGVIACGGTATDDVSKFTGNEGTWVRTGGGVSEIFCLPRWQNPPSVEVPVSVTNGANKRGIPDISGYANPGCDFIYNATSFRAPGTSVTTPLYAGMIALINEQIGSSVGFINPDLYALIGTPVFRDIADNRWNGYSGAPGYVSGPGWDACTGLGVVDGTALLNALR